MGTDDVLIIVDYQNDFIDGNVKIEGSDKLEKFIRYERKNGSYKDIIYTMDTHFPSTYYDLDQSKNTPIHCVFETIGWDMRIKTKSKHMELKEVKDHDMFYTTTSRHHKSFNEYIFTKNK